ncbi:MAG: MFS transporter [Nitrospinota bacterium]|nr:MFS transporter [Nitrospinota bacterium]
MTDDDVLEGKRNTAAITAWAMYDFANTIFSMVVVSRYFPLWVTEDMAAQDIYVAIPTSISMLMVALTVPLLGALSDQTGRRIRPLLIITSGCVLATAALGVVDTLWAGLICFAIANYCYQAALVFYDGLLPTVSRGASTGKVAGFGVALGYLGAVIGLAVATPIAIEYGRQAAFIPVAALFMLFSIPIFVLVKDVKVKAKKPLGEPMRQAFGHLIATFRAARERKNLFIFLVANLFILDCVNTVIAFMSVYAKKVMGMDGAALTGFQTVAILMAVVGAFAWGQLTHRIGAHKTMQILCAMWLLTVVVAASATNQVMNWSVGILAGLSMGGIWVAGRTMLTQLAPPERVGEFFGLFNLAGKAAAIIGPMLWGITVAVFTPLGGTTQHRLAVLSLGVNVIIGWILLRYVDPDKREQA